MSSKTADTLNLIPQYDKDEKLSIRTVDMTSTHLGRVSALTTIKNISKMSTFYVMDNLHYNIIIGLDMMITFNLSISRQLRIYQDTTTEDRVTTHGLTEVPSNYTASPPNHQSTTTINVLDLHHIDSPSLDEKSNNQLKMVVTHHTTVFSINKFDIGHITSECFKIELSSRVPINKRPYRCNPIDRAEIDKQIADLLQAGIIRQSTSPYASPTTLANKKNEGKTRLCVDSRSINDLTIPDRYPFPRVEDIVDKVRGCHYFTVLDITSGFWHIKVDEQDIEKTAFVTMTGHYEWLRMPFGYKNGPATFQRTIHNILLKHQLTSNADNYEDDILLFTKTFEEHLALLNRVLTILHLEGIKLNLRKCEFARTTVKYLGHMLSYNQVRPLFSNISAITNFPRPTEVTNVRQFIGKVNYYHKFIPNVSKLLSPLHDLLKKDVTFSWTPACENSFCQAKNYLCSKPVLAIYNPEETCYLFTDASRCGIGAVLKQCQEDGELHPIGYMSRTLHTYQKNYPVTELECLAIIEALDFWHHYLYGSKFVIYSDHSALRWLHSIKGPKGRLYNWVMKIGQYEAEIRYHPGMANVETDCLSRNPIHHNSDFPEHVKVVNLITTETLKQAQDKEPPDLPGSFMEAGLVAVRIRGIIRIVVPTSLQGHLLSTCHHNYGHLAHRKMLKLLSWRYYWPNMNRLIYKFTQRCHTCQTNKQKRSRPLGELGQQIATNPLDMVAIDTIGGLKGYSSEKQYAHVAVDLCTRYAWATCSRTQTAKDFINLFQQVSTLNTPKAILGDRYTGITSTEFKHFLQSKNVPLTLITTSCPQSNGTVERLNQTLMTRLRCKMNDHPQKIAWTTHFRAVLNEYNNSPHSVTGFPPRYLMLGVPPYAEAHLPPLPEARTIARQRSDSHHACNKKYYDARHRKHEFEPGDLVYVDVTTPIGRKLAPLRSGPFPVVRKISPTTYEVACQKRGNRTDRFNLCKLFPFVECDLPP